MVNDSRGWTEEGRDGRWRFAENTGHHRREVRRVGRRRRECAFHENKVRNQNISMLWRWAYDAAS